MNGKSGKAGKTSTFYVEKWKNGWKTIAKFLNFGYIFFCFSVGEWQPCYYKPQMS